VASPLGFSEATRDWYRDRLLPALAEVVEPVDPWALSTAEEFAAAAAAGQQRAFALEVGRRNARAIRSSALLVAHLDGQEPDSGTVVEVGYACGLGIRSYGIRSDLRQAGEAGVPLNLQVAALIEDSGGTIVDGLDALLALLREDLAAGGAQPA